MAFIDDYLRQMTSGQPGQWNPMEYLRQRQGAGQAQVAQQMDALHSQRVKYQQDMERVRPGWTAVRSVTGAEQGVGVAGQPAQLGAQFLPLLTAEAGARGAEQGAAAAVPPTFSEQLAEQRRRAQANVDMVLAGKRIARGAQAGGIPDVNPDEGY